MDHARGVLGAWPGLGRGGFQFDRPIQRHRLRQAHLEGFNLLTGLMAGDVRRLGHNGRQQTRRGSDTLRRQLRQGPLGGLIRFYMRDRNICRRDVGGNSVRQHAFRAFRGPDVGLAERSLRKKTEPFARIHLGSLVKSRCHACVPRRCRTRQSGRNRDVRHALRRDGVPSFHGVCRNLGAFRQPGFRRPVCKTFDGTNDRRSGSTGCSRARPYLYSTRMRRRQGFMRGQLAYPETEDRHFRTGCLCRARHGRRTGHGGQCPDFRCLRRPTVRRRPNRALSCHIRPAQAKRIRRHWRRGLGRLPGLRGRRESGRRWTRLSRFAPERCGNKRVRGAHGGRVPARSDAGINGELRRFGACGGTVQRQHGLRNADSGWTRRVCIDRRAPDPVRRGAARAGKQGRVHPVLPLLASCLPGQRVRSCPQHRLLGGGVGHWMVGVLRFRGQSARVRHIDRPRDFGRFGIVSGPRRGHVADLIRSLFGLGCVYGDTVRIVHVGQVRAFAGLRSLVGLGLGEEGCEVGGRLLTRLCFGCRHRKAETQQVAQLAQHVCSGNSSTGAP
ncbi:hypothetical protein MAA8898_00177 [Maliponia aquimaris]|uniref:Uncharacterized protein n=1 Tax=Maliponia aquimaris TaxID=1673631 RepID=A0A238JPV3_9RHOB|nr:hypothetical protein MAA8898_00177 [Maliponia aquimaris]